MRAFFKWRLCMAEHVQHVYELHIFIPIRIYGWLVTVIPSLMATSESICWRRYAVPWCSGSTPGIWVPQPPAAFLPVFSSMSTKGGWWVVGLRRHCRTPIALAAWPRHRRQADCGCVLERGVVTVACMGVVLMR